MAISHYRKQRIKLLARLNLGLASEEQEEIDLYNHYQKKYLFSTKSTTATKVKSHEQRRKKEKI